MACLSRCPQWRRTRASSSCAELVWAGLALVKRNGPRSGFSLQPEIWQLQLNAVSILWELVYFDTWRNCSLHLGTTFCFLYCEKCFNCSESVSARCSLFVPSAAPHRCRGRFLIKLLTWMTWYWNIWCKKVHSGDFLNLVFIHHRRIWLCPSCDIHTQLQYQRNHLRLRSHF